MHGRCHKQQQLHIRIRGDRPNTHRKRKYRLRTEAVADDRTWAAYAADEGQAVPVEQTAPVEQVAAEPVAEQEAAVRAPAEQPTAESTCSRTADKAEAPAAETPTVTAQETAPAAENVTAETPEEDATQAEAENQQLTWSQDVGDTTVKLQKQEHFLQMHSFP